MPTTPSGLRYPSSSAAPNVAQDIQNLASDVEGKVALAAWHKSFARPTPTGTDSYTSADGWRDLVGGTWTSAPAGEYLLHSTLVLQGTANIAGELRVTANGTVLTPASTRADVPTDAALPLHSTYGFYYGGGNLVIAVAHRVTTTGTATVYNTSSHAILQYLGRRS